jgi:hypothetical protein
MDTTTYNLWSIILGALTLIALGIYTYFTYRLLRATQNELRVMQDQLSVARVASDSTQRELEILQGQLVTAQKALDTQQDRERRAARPIFVWRGGGINPSDRRANFQNIGGPIAVIETRALHCSFTLAPQNFIDRGTTGTFNIGSAPHVGAVIFVGIKYVTAMNEIRSTVFKIEPGTISPRIELNLHFEGMSKMDDPPQPVDLIGD